MKTADKNKLLLVNALIWLAAFVIPPLIEFIPTSHPPKIYPLVFFVFRVVLAALSTYLLYSALSRPTDESQAADNQNTRPTATL